MQSSQGGGDKVFAHDPKTPHYSEHSSHALQEYSDANVRPVTVKQMYDAQPEGKSFLVDNFLAPQVRIYNLHVVFV